MVAASKSCRTAEPFIELPKRSFGKFLFGVIAIEDGDGVINIVYGAGVE
jgi:hypothetical protein